MASKGKLLIIDDEIEVLNTLQRVFHKDYQVYTTESVNEAFEILSKFEIQVILCDQRMPEMKGTDFLTQVKNLYPKIIRILITGYSALYDVILATNESDVFKYLTKPWNVLELKNTVSDAFEKNILIEDNEKMLQEIKNANILLEEVVRERTQELEKMNEKLELLNKQLEEMAITDTLTSLYNRRYLDNIFKKETLRAARLNLDMVLLLIDINNFKQVNDNYGHLAGDVLLKKFSEVALSLTRAGLDFVFRMGGDEFLFIMNDCDEISAHEVAKRLDLEFRKHSSVISLAYGIVEMEKYSNHDFEKYFKLADERMYRHKKMLNETAMTNA